MKVIEVEQGSDAWLNLRRNKITGTDAGVIIGTNPYKDQLQLWEEKNMFKPPEATNAAMRRGTELEPVARDLLINAVGIKFNPIVALHDSDDWCMSSLDGISECGEFICEIKCPGQATHERCMNNDIPEYYYTQIQHSLYVTGAKSCYYCCYRPEYVHKPLIYYTINVHKEYIGRMIDLEKKWYHEHLIGFKAPERWTLKVKNLNGNNL